MDEQMLEEQQDWLEKAYVTLFFAVVVFYLIDFFSVRRHQKIQKVLMSCCTKSSSRSSDDVPCLFPQFSELPKEVQVSVISFVADMPCENDDLLPNGSTVTHVLPLVSKSFRDMAYSDSIWKTGWYRIAHKQPSIWETGLIKLLPNEVEPNSDDLLESVRERTGLASFMEVYERVLNSTVRFKGLSFHMRGRVCLGERFNLHFFEPRYRRLIRTVMHGYPEPYVNGEPIHPDSPALAGLRPPIFIYVNSGVEYRSPAVIVRVQKCVINPSGTADVSLVPIAHAWLEMLWIDQPHIGDHLYAAQVMRMPRAHSDRMEDIRRQPERDFFEFITINGIAAGLNRITRARAAQHLGVENINHEEDDDEDDSAH